MRYSCCFHNKTTDERRSVIVWLTASECKSVDSLRRHKGNETADVTAAAMALTHAYREVNPTAWHHVESPSLIQPS